MPEYQVWHKAGDRYEKAATVNTADVQGAAILTAFRVERWGDHPQIKPEPGEHRSTTFGDVIIDPEGQEYRFVAKEMEGFEGKYPAFEATTAIRDQGREEYLPIGVERTASEAFAELMYDISHPPDFRALERELRTDYEAARIRDAGQDYEAFVDRRKRAAMQDQPRFSQQRRTPTAAEFHTKVKTSSFEHSHIPSYTPEDLAAMKIVAEEERYAAAEELLFEQRWDRNSEHFYGEIEKEMRGESVYDEFGAPHIVPEIKEEFNKRIADFEAAKKQAWIDREDGSASHIPMDIENPREAVGTPASAVIDIKKDPHLEGVRTTGGKDKDRGIER